MAKCEDCGTPYSEMGVDIVLPNQVWNRLAKPGEILCGNCICKRLDAAGSTSVLLCWPDKFDYSIPLKD